MTSPNTVTMPPAEGPNSGAGHPEAGLSPAAPVAAEGMPSSSPEQVHAELLHDPSVLTLHVRRHSEYSRGAPDVMGRGSLNPRGRELARKSAQAWAASLPADAEVSIYQSPSFQEAQAINPDDPTQKVPVQAARAMQTAGFYETEIFGGREPGRSTTETRLGDFFEQASGPKIKDFFKVVGDYYGGLSANFWEHFAARKLVPEVDQAMREAGGQDSLQLAKNFTEWLGERSNRDKPEQGHKQVGLAVTHGETIYSFLYNLSGYLEATGSADEATIAALRKFDPDYNQGMDVHVADDKVTVVIANQHAVAFPLDQYKQYLDGQPLTQAEK